MKKTILTSLNILALSFAPLFVFAADGVLGLIEKVKVVLQAVLPLIGTLAVIYFLWSLTQYMTKAGEQQKEAKEQMVWGVIILFVMVSVWGLVEILSATIL
ncbi:MAG: hypothetical protein ABIG87_00320 [Patescibacteria group bacterium]